MGKFCHLHAVVPATAAVGVTWKRRRRRRGGVVARE
jgi:hypothetical protein